MDSEYEALMAELGTTKKTGPLGQPLNSGPKYTFTYSLAKCDMIFAAGPRMHGIATARKKSNM